LKPQGIVSSGAAHIRIAKPLSTKSTFGSMTWNKYRVIAHGPQTLCDAGNQSIVIALRKICAPNTARKQNVTHKGALNFR